MEVILDSSLISRSRTRYPEGKKREPNQKSFPETDMSGRNSTTRGRGNAVQVDFHSHRVSHRRNMSGRDDVCVNTLVQGCGSGKPILYTAI